MYIYIYVYVYVYIYIYIYMYTHKHVSAFCRHVANTGGSDFAEQAHNAQHVRRSRADAIAIITNSYYY